MLRQPVLITGLVLGPAVLSHRQPPPSEAIEAKARKCPENVVVLISTRCGEELSNLIADVTKRCDHAAPGEAPSGQAVSDRSHMSASPLSINEVPGTQDLGFPIVGRYRLVAYIILKIKFHCQRLQRCLDSVTPQQHVLYRSYWGDRHTDDALNGKCRSTVLGELTPVGKMWSLEGASVSWRGLRGHTYSIGIGRHVLLPGLARPEAESGSRQPNYPLCRTWRPPFW